MRRLTSLLLVVAACGPGDAGATTTTVTQTTSPPSTIEATTTTTSSPTTSTTDSTTTTPAETTTTAPDIDVIVEGGTEEVPELSVLGPDTFEVALGETVSIEVLAGIEDEIHVHGYDLFFDTIPGEVVEVEFVADVPGIFEVELESVHFPLFLIEVGG